jgi:hypothetical protein
MSRIRGEYGLDPKYGMLLEQKTWNWNPNPQLVSVAAAIPNGKEMFTPPHSVGEQSSPPCRSAAVVGAAVASITGTDHHAHAQWRIQKPIARGANCC